MKTALYGVIVLVALAFAGCMGNRLQNWASRCEQYGFQHGTAAMAACIQREDIAWQEGFDRAFVGAIQSLQQMTTPPPAPQQVVCQRYGSTTVCY